MYRTVWVVATATAFLFVAAGPAAAGSDAVRTMARITMSLNHFPSDDDKAVLTEIIDSEESSEEEAAVAMAIKNMQHQVGAEDAKRLNDIVDDDTADDSVRELADILLTINHAASDDDKDALAALAGE